MTNVCYKSNQCSPAISVVVCQTTEGIKGLANCFVFVQNINSTFYISPCHEITVIYSGPVFVDDYDAAENPLNLRGQKCYDYANNLAYIFNNQGKYRVIPLVDPENEEA